jgi:hypothetical protein
MEETKAKVAFSLSFLEKCGVVEKCGYDEKERQYKFCLTDEAQKMLDDLVKTSDGNRSAACMALLFLKCATGKKNALTETALGFHMHVLHLVAFNEKPSDADFHTTECDGLCELCSDETCPAKELVEEDKTK